MQSLVLGSPKRFTIRATMEGGLPDGYISDLMVREHSLKNGDRNMLKKSLRMAGLVVVAAVGMAGAHLSTTGLTPKGGETLHVGDAVSIKWTETVHHAGGTDIDLSIDGGKTWTTVKKAFADLETLNTFNWTVPNSVSTSAKLRICLGAGASCSDVKVSDPASNPPYVIVTDVFTIAAASSVIPSAEQSKDMSVQFNSDTRNVDVSFGLTESKDVQLQAFDTQGRLLATLIQGAFAAGNYRLSLFSNRLDISGGSLIFKLKIGDQLKSHTWTMVR